MGSNMSCNLNSSKEMLLFNDVGLPPELLDLCIGYAVSLDLFDQYPRDGHFLSFLVILKPLPFVSAALRIHPQPPLLHSKVAEDSYAWCSRCLLTE